MYIYFSNFLYQTECNHAYFKLTENSIYVSPYHSPTGRPVNIPSCSAQHLLSQHNFGSQVYLKYYQRNERQLAHIIFANPVITPLKLFTLLFILTSKKLYFFKLKHTKEIQLSLETLT